MKNSLQIIALLSVSACMLVFTVIGGMHVLEQPCRCDELQTELVTARHYNDEQHNILLKRIETLEREYYCTACHNWMGEEG